MTGKRKNKGWRNEPIRHGLASKGIETTSKGRLTQPKESQLLRSGLIVGVNVLEENIVGEDEVEVELELINLGNQATTHKGNVRLIVDEDKLDEIEVGKRIDLDYRNEKMDTSRNPHNSDYKYVPMLENMEIKGDGLERLNEWKEKQRKKVKEANEDGYISDEELKGFKNQLKEDYHDIKKEITKKE